MAAGTFPAGLRVLAVDDDHACLNVLERQLKYCNYNVTMVADAQTALDMLRERKDRNQFDLLISDVYMPKMDGFKLLEFIGLEMDLPVITLQRNMNVPSFIGSPSSSNHYAETADIAAEMTADTFPAGLRVLTVEDDRVCHKVLERQLKYCNYNDGVGHAQGKEGREPVRPGGQQCRHAQHGFKLLELIGLEMDLPVISKALAQTHFPYFYAWHSS
ncbi:uncharacterized protein [Miscanthus floridulus]|uniref:uncharacterized protein isoform X4 n=1 Tax=Miscanthus floridulus TaxID=154761 RepID=UPI003459E4A7